jgi:hypothetical protein
LCLDQPYQVSQSRLSRHFLNIGKPDILDLTIFVRRLFANQWHPDEDPLLTIFQAHGNQL